MAITNAIPEIWSAKILTQFQERAIFAGLANREYEGEAKTGSVVHITGISPIVIKDYKAAGRLTSPDEVTDTGIDLPIDNEKSFDFFVDDIDMAQAKPQLMNAYTKSAADGLVTDADKTLAALLIAQGTPVTPLAPATDGVSAWNVIRDLKKAMAKALVPASERVIVFNAEFAALLDENDSKLMKANESASTAGLRDASYGKLLSFDSYSSENLPVVDLPQIVGFHKSALAYASTINKTEAMRSQNKFADRLRGLHVYGAKNLRPDAVYHWTGAVTP
ncbi:P22 phage major capsid protein family protein [Glutamicibacter sp.]|uniref:P22 phage major capsid protein family protein n=1 Tax=Glutamicibacter sp. TaxID=1931995 RepID=UPI002B470233|nr:P22 phage major capsid protein family protein [Glutamicibacter sp.]HJX78568.1 P22 phage major capsid protein family protein [Glutamicibacter sp.]